MALSRFTGSSVYLPNPFTDKLVILSPIDDVLLIRSVMGTIIDSYTVTEGETTIFLNQLDSGIYFVTSTSVGITLRILKQ